MALLERVCDRDGIPWQYGMVSGDALVSRSRSIVGSNFVRSDCDVLLTIDSDIWFRPEDALKLVQKCREGKDLISALYLTRGLENQPALMMPQGDTVFHAGAEPVEVPFCSTGFMATHRRVFEALRDELPHCHQGWNDRGQDTSFWPFYMPYTIPWEGDGYLYLSEDWAFCQRAKEHGYTCWLDPSIRLGHYGEVMFTLEDKIRPGKMKPQPLMFRQRGENLQVYAVGEEQKPTPQLVVVGR